MSERPFRDFDWSLLIAALVICGVGIVEIYSTQVGDPEAGQWHQRFWFKQLVGAALGACVFAFVARMNFRRVFDWAPYVYGATLILLAAVLVVGVRINGQRCWIRLGPLGTLQPSEFAKLGTILMLGRVLHPLPGGALTLRQTATAIAVVAAPVGLILLEPDTGTALTFFPVLAVMIFLSGVNIRLIAVAVGAAAIIAPFGFKYVVEPHLKPYQRDRINVTWNAIFYPERLQDRATREGFGYQTLQSMIAVGSGGILGKGVTKGTQSQGGFVPEQHSDFIGSVLAEELGLVGSLLTLALYLYIILHSARVAGRARERFGMLVLAGYMTLLAFHTVINIGMVVGLVPIMGIPLPLLSAGGSSLLMTFASLGLVANVRQRRFVN
jgi:rod shape determining protein RodA